MRSSLCSLLSFLALSACCTASPPASVVAPPSTVAVLHDVSETASDRVVTDRIRTLFREDFEIAPVQGDVAIATARSVVTLTGTTHSDRQRLVMAAHARATEGVTSVVDHIVLAP